LEDKAGLINEDDRAAFTPGFFYPGPGLSWPFGNRLLVAFPGTPLGFLGAPA
jgi:hypothetical protein